MSSGNDSRETKPVIGIRRLKEAMPKPAHPRIFTVANQKGGVGKTTTTVNVAAALSMGGLKVLVIDLDPQGNASTALGVEHRDNAGIYEVLMGDTPVASVVQKVAGFPSLDCISSNTSLAQAEINLVSMVARELRLKEAIDELNQANGYDYIFIDCPPSLGLLTVNALAAAKELMIPIQCEYYALEGLSDLVETLRKVRHHLNSRLEIEGLLRTMYNGQSTLTQQVSSELESHFGDKVYKTIVPRNVRLAEAPSYGKPVIAFDKNSKGAQAYSALAQEILERVAS